MKFGNTNLSYLLFVMRLLIIRDRMIFKESWELENSFRSFSIILLSEIIIFNVRVSSVCYDTVGLSDVGKITFYFLPSVSSWSSVFSCVRTSVINVDIWERMWTVWDRLVLHGQLVGHWLVHLWCILQYCKVRSRSGFTSNKSGGPADKCLFDLQDKLSFLTANITWREEREAESTLTTDLSKL